MTNDFNPLGTDLFGDPVRAAGAGPLADRFTMPPFSILDARGGDWQHRKQAWIGIGIESEVGRGGLGDTCATPMSYFMGGKTVAGDSGSIFDPVVCELAYSWFCPVGGQVVDPFAGGSVRGVVAKHLGRRYWGCDLRQEQVSANVRQAEKIFPGFDGLSGDMFGGSDLQWHCGDSIDTVPTAPDADFVFSCPPYGDLERYSEDPRDLSTMEWHTFEAAYSRVILRAVERLRDNRFACFVVGDFRDKGGFMRNFIGVTVNAFKGAGAPLYNEAVLVTPVGTAAIRASAQFDASRKLCKTHQNVLVFCKGDPKEATAVVLAAAGVVK